MLTRAAWLQLATIVGQFGVVCISRGGSDPAAFVQAHDLLWTHQRNITIVHEWIRHDLSSTAIRSVRPVVPPG